MRRFISILVVVLTVLAVANAGVREDFKANPKLSANNYQAYPTSGFPALTAAPDGYEPFFINHYGRHGSQRQTHPPRPGSARRAATGA